MLSSIVMVLLLLWTFLNHIHTHHFMTLKQRARFVHAVETIKSKVGGGSTRSYELRSILIVT